MPKWMLASLLCFCIHAAPPARAADDVVLFHAKIFTGEPEHPYAEAVAIRDDKIVAVGSSGEVSKLVATDAKFIDLNGKFLMPGMIDSHCHAVGGGLLLISALVAALCHPSRALLGHGFRRLSSLAEQE